MTDNEIIKALEICQNENGMCSDCPYSDDYTNCNTRIAKDVLDLINRQKAEIEVKRGGWIELPSNGIGNTAECSVCHDSVYGYESCDFCPNCGADMRGGDKR